MKKEGWEYVMSHWGEADEAVMNQIAAFKDEEEVELNNLNKQIEDAKAENLKLTQQNVEVNKTNMALILRLTDPSLPPPKKEEEYKAPAVTDYSAFIK